MGEVEEELLVEAPHFSHLAELVVMTLYELVESLFLVDGAHGLTFVFGFDNGLDDS